MTKKSSDAFEEWKASLPSQTLESLIEARARVFIDWRTSQEEYTECKAMLWDLERRKAPKEKCDHWRSVIARYERDELPEINARYRRNLEALDAALKDKGWTEEKLKQQDTNAMGYDLSLSHRSALHPDEPVPEFLLK